MRINNIFKAAWSRVLKPLLKLPFIILKTVLSMFKTIIRIISEKLRLSITFRMTAAYAFIITLTLIFLSAGVLAGGFTYIMRSEGNELYKDFSLVSSYIAEAPEQSYAKISQLAEASSRSFTIFDENRKCIYTTEKKPELAIFIDRSSSNNAFEAGNTMLIANPAMPEADVPRELFNSYGFAMVYNNSFVSGTKTYYIQIIDKLTSETEYAGVFIITLAVMDIFFIILILILGAATSKRLLKPVKVMTETVQNISINQLGTTRLDVSGSKNELKDLARTFNSMLDRLQLAYEQQNQFVSDASHELRTPISVIQGYAGLLDRWGKSDSQVLEESITAIRTEAENMKDLVEKLLFLARGDKDTQKLDKQEFYINELVDEMIKETQLIDTTHEVGCSRNEVILVNADRTLLKEAIRVFVDNSVKYTPEGGKIKLECFLEKGSAIVTIEDTGIGIPEKDLPKVFDRFFRADKSRTKETGGTGLGMAIAKWIILKHGGTIKVQSKVNVGTKVIVTLPI
ncbi:MAG: ATP-binding protein [Pseudomonadota bacterium]